jgi:hypothetical protein
LIKVGSGYWKYLPEGDHIRFLTWYDYKVRFGLLGQLLDFVAFRPLIGWATAWSFDTLRLWLEKGIEPAWSIRTFLTHVVVHVALAATWIYQGLVPKLLVPDSGELAILQASGLFNGLESIVLMAVGIGEILFGLLFLLPRLRPWLHYLNVIGLLILGAGGVISQPLLVVAPFNPVTLTLTMSALSLIALLNGENLPYATNCRRKPTEEGKR